jgi:glycosyltransferase involved in cell wall biosynthesis
MVENFPRVSIIIPSRNGQTTIGKCLTSLLSLDYPDFEIIVINDGSTDATAKIAAEFAAKDSRVMLLATAGVGPSAARNLGIAVASGAYFAFTDDDCIADRAWLRELLSGFGNDIAEVKKIAGVGGDQLSPADESSFGRTLTGFLKVVGFVADYVKTDSDDDAVRYTQHNPTCNVMYRRDVVKGTTGFKEGLWPGEDVEFDRRLTLSGYRHRYNPRAIVYHYRPADIKKFWRMMFSYGRVQAYLVRQNGFFRKIHYEPVALACYLLVAVINPGSAVLAGFLLTPPALAFLYFVYKTGTIAKAANYEFFLVLTVAAWNAGFVRGIIGKTK